MLRLPAATAVISFDRNKKVDYAMFATLWVGECEADYVCDAVEELRRLGPVVVEGGEPIAAASDVVSNIEAECSLIVVVERFPGERTSLQFDSLRRRFPTFPIVRLCGPLCDGELRSRVPPPALRLPWHRAAAFFAEASEKLSRGECPAWGRPVTETEEERLANANWNRPRLPKSLRVGVTADRPANAAWLLDAIVALGATATQIEDYSTSTADFDVLVSDLATASPEPPSLPATTAIATECRGIALVDFLRPEGKAYYRRWGFATVLSKPCSLDDLSEALAKNAKTQHSR